MESGIGERILPEGWVEASMEPTVDVSASNDRKYGFQWWLLPYDGGARYAYTDLGYGGQRVLVLTELDFVAVFTGWNIYDRPALSAGMVLERLLEASR